MIVTRDQIVAEARSWIHTPFIWQASLKGVGCDCKGLMVGIARELGMPEAETIDARIDNYEHTFSPDRLLAGLEATLIRVDRAQPGDLIAMPMGPQPGPRHLAVLTESGRILHSMGGGLGFVAEVQGPGSRIHSVWTWPSLGTETWPTP